MKQIGISRHACLAGLGTLSLFAFGIAGLISQN